MKLMKQDGNKEFLEVKEDIKRALNDYTKTGLYIGEITNLV